MNNQTAYSTFNTFDACKKYFTIGRKEKEEELVIETPSSFTHVIGVKSSTKGLQMVGDADRMLRVFLHVAGLSGSILSNPRQKDEIDRFV